MERKDFLKSLTLAGASLSVLQGCGSSIIQCAETPAGEEGPFPTKEPTSLLSQNIVADRAGTALAVKIIIYNINDNCKVIKDAVVDIWHCDNKGEYSEYGGSSSGMMPPRQRDEKDHHPMPPPPDSNDRNNGQRPPPPMGGGSMQSADHTSEHFLRGRQMTNIEALHHSPVYFRDGILAGHHIFMRIYLIKMVNHF